MHVNVQLTEHGDVRWRRLERSAQLVLHRADVSTCVFRSDRTHRDDVTVRIGNRFTQSDTVAKVSQLKGHAKRVKGHGVIKVTCESVLHTRNHWNVTSGFPRASQRSVTSSPWIASTDSGPMSIIGGTKRNKTHNNNLATVNLSLYDLRCFCNLHFTSSSTFRTL